MAGVYEGVDAYGRDIFEGQVQDSKGNWVPAVKTGMGQLIDQSRPAEGIEWRLDGTPSNYANWSVVSPPTMEESAVIRSTEPELAGQTFLPNAGPGYKYGTGMDIGLPDIAPNAKQMPPVGDEGLDANGRPIWGGFVQDNSGAWIVPGTGGAPDWTLPDIGVNIPTSGPGYKTGTGMDFTLSDIAPNGPFESANNPNTVGGQVYEDGTLDSGGRPIWGGYVQNDNGIWVAPGSAGALHGDTPTWQLGDAGFGSLTESANNPNTVGGAPSASDLNGFSSTGSGGIDALGRPIWGGYVQAEDGSWVTPAEGGGYDAGDMGDAATTQGHTDYMNAARAAAAKEAEYQSRVRAEREAIDASIAWAAAQANSWNPQYNGQVNFNNNVFAQNPTNIYDRWASGQSTQYQPY